MVLGGGEKCAPYAIIKSFHVIRSTIMEPVGLAVGIVSLYNTFIEVSSRVRDYKEFGVESQTTLLRFDASKLKLQNWAKALGIHDGRLIDSHDPRLDDPQTASVIQNILRWSTTTFDKIEARSTSLRLPLRQRSAGTDGWFLPSDDIRHEVDRRQNSSTKSRIAWATGGKARLSKDVSSFEELVNILSDVVPPRELEEGSKIKCIFLVLYFICGIVMTVLSISSE